MEILFMIKLLYFRNKLLSHDLWSREKIEKYQARAFEKLRNFTYENSLFYQRFHKGLSNCPLQELPILTKKELMNNFDETVTDPQIKLIDLYSHLALLETGDKYLNRYRVSSTSGSSGLKGIFPFNEDEWAIAAASYLRASDWAGVSVGLTKRVKVAVIGSTIPWHVSSGVGASLNSWWVPTINIDVTDPITKTVKKLNEFKPQCLMGYPSAIRLLAEQQIEGGLNISPRAIFCTSEVLTDDSRERIQYAFGAQPFNVYASTETAGFASECSEHNGMHLFEDLVITEVVDDNDRPVPNGEYGKRILVTVLSSRTIPLIRYEITDSVKIEDTKCECKLPFRTITGIQGRKEEILYFLDDYGEKVKVEPNVFHKVLEMIPVAGWQIIQDTETSLRVQIYQPREEYSESFLIEKLKAELTRENVNPEILVDYVDALHLNETGKIILIKSLVNNSMS